MQTSENAENIHDAYGPGCELLPSWFTFRMMEDEWHFGLLLVTGKIMTISNIRKITQDASGQLWVEVSMWQERHMDNCDENRGRFGAPTTRCKASVNASHIVAAFELSDT